MSSRSSEAEADLILAEFAGLLENYNSFDLEVSVGDRYNAVIQRMEALLGEDLKHLMRDNHDRFNENIRQPSEPRWRYWVQSLQSKGRAALTYLKSSRSRRRRDQPSREHPRRQEDSNDGEQQGR